MLTWALVSLVKAGASINAMIFALAMLGDLTMWCVAWLCIAESFRSRKPADNASVCHERSELAARNGYAPEELPVSDDAHTTHGQGDR